MKAQLFIEDWLGSGVPASLLLLMLRLVLVMLLLLTVMMFMVLPTRTALAVIFTMTTAVALGVLLFNVYFAFGIDVNVAKCPFVITGAGKIAIPRLFQQHDFPVSCIFEFFSDIIKTDPMRAINTLVFYLLGAESVGVALIGVGLFLRPSQGAG